MDSFDEVMKKKRAAEKKIKEEAVKKIQASSLGFSYKPLDEMPEPNPTPAPTPEPVVEVKEEKPKKKTTKKKAEKTVKKVEKKEVKKTVKRTKKVMKKGPDKKVDIIIPCYNSHETLPILLDSIGNQFYKEQCLITIVNDGGKGYKEIVDKYKNILDIQEVKLPVNSGPGAARQFGLENTDCPYIMFMDSDDYLPNPNCITPLLTKIQEDERYKIVCGKIEAESNIKVKTDIEIPQDKKFYVYWSHKIFVYGKIIRRSFIDEYQIKCVPGANNEDVAFNLFMDLFIDNEERLKVLVNYPVYHRTVRKGSLTNQENDTFAADSLPSLRDSVKYIRENLKKAVNTVSLGEFGCDVMVFIYKQIEHLLVDGELTNEALDAAAELYDLSYRQTKQFSNPETLNKSYTEQLLDQVDMIRKLGELYGLTPVMQVPKMTFEELEKLLESRLNDGK